tara:strand:+ start:258 stop:1031 length:774 start_codon:yes stop_codon:yes gene_type:complete
MKRISILASALMLWATSAQATIVYNNFNPDHTMTLSDGTLSFDLDGDMNDDITFAISGTGASNYVLSVTGPKLEFVVDQIANPSYTESLFIGKEVHSGKKWAANNVRIASSSNKDIAGNPEFFMGIRFVSGSNYFYGWALMELKSNLDLVIKSVAFDNSLNKSIVVGNTGAVLLSEKEVQEIDWSIYPTVVENAFTIEASEELSSLEIWNTAGTLLKQEEINAMEARIDIADLPKGVYFIKVHSLKGELLENRLIKQ